jgi:putative membrane protein
MKKLSLFAMLLMGAFFTQSCGDSETSKDPVEKAETTNEANSTIKEDDSEFIVKAASGGMMEVQAGQMAQQKAVNARIKSFGEMMVADHTKANDELKALAATKNITVPPALGEDHQKHVNDLQTKAGKDFDKEYMSMMLDDHKKDVSDFEKAAENATDPDIKAFAAKTLPVLRMHLDSAQAIKDAMK